MLLGASKWYIYVKLLENIMMLILKYKYYHHVKVVFL